jgi:hypothetical protein
MTKLLNLYLGKNDAPGKGLMRYCFMDEEQVKYKIQVPQHYKQKNAQHHVT